jgi:hypothetical protein
MAFAVQLTPSSDPFCTGYQDMGGVQLMKVNGTEIESMAQLAALLHEAGRHEGGDSFYELELSDAQLLVLDVKACTEREGGILEAYGLSQPRSAELR